MNEPNNGLPGRYSNKPGQINRLVKLEPIPKKTETSETEEPRKIPSDSSVEQSQSE